jgi:hypothetical protein
MIGRRGVEIVLLIGAQPYRLDEQQARWLEERVRSTCLETSAVGTTPMRTRASRSRE